MAQKSDAQLMLARKVGEGFVVYIDGKTVEITLAYIANNTAAILIETAAENLVLRKELVDLG